ncbi:MAG: DNA polymerase III subunit beta [Candidatus Omnitrophica bacterium]|nr:DNA polymerase III subunit beta [Candidatus Omnitrophota bacterium]
MKFILNKDILVENLQRVFGPTTTKQNFPVLTSVLITTVNNVVVFTTTDLDITVISSQKTNESTPGQVVIPMKRFFSVIRELPPQEVSIETVKNNLLIKCGKVEFKINTLNNEEFPKPPENKNASLIKLISQELEEMIKLTSFAVGQEDVSYVLSGVLFEIEKNQITLVSTDGKRLAVTQKPLPINQPELKEKISFILPIKAIIELHKLVKEHNGEIYLSVNNNAVEFNLKETQFIARTLEGEFPNYSQYIPTENKDVLTINRKNLLFALRRASLLSTQDHQGVTLTLKKDNLIVWKNTPQLGEVKEEIGVGYNGAGLEIGFNPGYLIDALKNLEDETITINFFGTDKPAVLKKEGYVYLLLPIKI